MTKSRLEAFSDGVLAIAITLLTLDLPVPGHDEVAQHHGLWGALVNHWPSFAAYVISFTVIGIMWVNHHALIQRVAVVDRPLLYLNLLLLLFIAAIPFSTRLFAEFLRTGSADSHVAAAVYSANAFGCAIGFNSMWRWLVRDDRRLHVKIDPVVLKRSTRRFSLGIFVYLATIGLSFVSAPATLAVHGAVAVYYVVDQLPRGARDEEPAA
jgi:uncharacterized membrane protein